MFRDYVHLIKKDINSRGHVYNAFMNTVVKPG
jgi:hypothetical protein